MKISFLFMALKCIAKNIASQAGRTVAGSLFILHDDLVVYAELTCRYHWNRLTAEYQSALGLKKSESLEKIHAELVELMKRYPELDGFDLSTGDPFMALVKARALSADDFVQKHGDKKKCVDVSSIDEIVVAVMEYNFFYKYKKLLADFFKVLEEKMRVLSKRDKWPGRGSWNSTVEHDESKQKKEVNFGFLSAYAKRKEAIAE